MGGGGGILKGQEESIIERVDIQVSVVDFPSILEFSKLCLLVETKILTLCYVVVYYEKEIFKTLQTGKCKVRQKVLRFLCFAQMEKIWTPVDCFCYECIM